jgi:stage II sporulation protein D
VDRSKFSRAYQASRPMNPRRFRARRTTKLVILLAAAGILAGLVFAPMASAATGDFVITGRGNGHGEGMSQWGAWQGARSGNTYQQILAFYYPGTTLTTLNSVVPTRETITVRLTTSVDTFTSVKLTAAATSAKLLDSTGATISTLAVGGSVTLVYSGGKVQVSGSSATYTYVDFKPDSTSGRVTVTPSTLWSSGIARSYWGYIRIMADATAGQVYVQNILPIDKYVAGVSEIASDWAVPTSTSTYAPEAVKAQDVAARTYIANHTGSVPYDDSRDMNYVGYNFEASYPYATTAAEETADMVLTYGGKLAGTHFSSSSGGYTSNSAWSDTGAPVYEPAKRDAWSAAAPVSNPGWAWTITVSPATLASDLSGNLNVGTITNVQVTARDTADADSHARTITVTGTSGTATIPARTFKSLVGLRSTLILSIAKDGGSGLTRYDHTNTSIVKTGTWENFSTTKAYGGSYGRSSTSKASATIYFTGTRLDWIGMKGVTTGIAEVYLDGTLKATINLAASAATYQVNLWSTGTLTSGAHYVKIVRSASSASGKFVTLDAVDIWGTITGAP